MQEPYQKASRVIRWFQGESEDGCGTRYCKLAVPRAWKPELAGSYPILNPYIETRRQDVHFSSFAVLLLKHFQFSKIGERGLGRGPGSLASILSSWIHKLQGVRVWDGAQGLGEKVGYWHFKYAVGRTRGAFTVWIQAGGPLSSTMISQVSEWYDSDAHHGRSP